MIRWYFAGAAVLFAIGLYRTVAVGRTQAKTLTEQKRDLFGDLPVAYRITQPRHQWKLRLARKNPQRRSA